MAAFDWYQATIPASVDDVLEGLLGLAETVHLEHGRGAHGFAHSTVLRDADGPLARLWHGGSHTYPHAIVTGENAPAGAELIRASFPEHFVSRADVCEDFAGDDTFDRVVPVLLGAAVRHRVKVDTRGDHLLTKDGRTVYLGSASSSCRLRLYDKAAELRSKFAADPVMLAKVPDHLSRLEVQVRPQTRDARERFATIEPVAVMGSSAFVRQVWKGVVGLDLDPVQVGKPWRQADDARAYACMLAQYGPLLQRLAQVQGWQVMGLQIRDDLAEREQAKRRGL